MLLQVPNLWHLEQHHRQFKVNRAASREPNQNFLREKAVAFNLPPSTDSFCQPLAHSDIEPPPDSSEAFQAKGRNKEVASTLRATPFAHFTPLQRRHFSPVAFLCLAPAPADEIFKVEGCCQKLSERAGTS